MKYIIFAAILLAMPRSTFGQSNVTQIEYFLDYDKGFGQNTILNISTPNTDITQAIIANIPASTALGYHKLYFRAKDADGNWSHTIKKHIEIVAPYTENNIVIGEYFISEDNQFGTGTSFTIDTENEDIEQAFTAQILASTPIGFHKLYGRVKDSKGNWSHTFRKNIQVYTNPITNIIEIEYFFGDDLEFGNNTRVTVDTPIDDGTWVVNVPYSAGDYHLDDTLFIRVKDSNGDWSITTTLDEISTLNTTDAELSKVKLHPNPFNDNLNIKIPDNVNILKTTIYNNLGQNIFNTSDNKPNLHLENLESGVYILILNTDAANTAFKLVKN